MALDSTAQKYAQNLFLKRMEEIGTSQRAELVRIRTDFASRGMLRSGPYLTAHTNALLEHVRLLAEARKDSLLDAYTKARLPFDDAALDELTQDITTFCDAQQRNAMASVQQQVAQTFAQSPPGLAKALSNQIETGVSRIRSRLLRDLSIKRDEAILAAPSNRFSNWIGGDAWVRTGTLIAAFFVPEVRRFLGLEKPPEKPEVQSAKNGDNKKSANAKIEDQAKTTDPLQISPHLQTRLVIDSIPQDAEIKFHIEVENISKFQVNELRAGMRTQEMISLEVSAPLPPTLPPGGRLSIPGNPVSGLRKYGALFLDLNYENKEDDRTNKFISKYSFLIRPDDMKPQAILPTTWQEQAGVILGPQEETVEAALKTLAGSTGTMLFTLPLRRPDGSPNFLVITNNKRKFSFEGGSRSISFATTKSSGIVRTITHALPDGSYDAIVIGCLWDDQKDEAKLIINGQEYR